MNEPKQSFAVDTEDSDVECSRTYAFRSMHSRARTYRCVSDMGVYTRTCSEGLPPRAISYLQLRTPLQRREPSSENLLIEMTMFWRLAARVLQQLLGCAPHPSTSSRKQNSTPSSNRNVVLATLTRGRRYGLQSHPLNSGRHVHALACISERPGHCSMFRRRPLWVVGGTQGGQGKV